METLEFNVDASANNIRIDRYLADQCPEHSRSYIQKLLKEEQVLVNGRVIKANYKTQSGDYIEFHIPDPEVLDILPENIPLDILYEDDYVLVVNKPKDMVVHPSAGHTSGTLVNAVMAHCGEHLSGINGVLRPGIVHRIDKDTTGALLICKDDVVHRDLAEQLSHSQLSVCTSGDCVAMTTMGGGEIIFGLDGCEGACFSCLLTDAQMNVACQHALGEAVCCVLFKCTNPNHSPVKLHQLIFCILFFCSQ